MDNRWQLATPEQRRKRMDAVARHRKKVIREIKEMAGGCCVFCGYSRCFRALEFHHVDPEQKDFAVSVTGATRAWKLVMAEISKCILVCANCHREIHDGLISQEMIEVSFKGSSMVEPTAVNRVVVSSTLTP